MRCRTAVATLLLACCMIAPPAAAQNATPAAAQIAAPEAEIMRKVAQTYHSLGTYLFEGNIHVVVQGSGKPQIQDAPFFVAGSPGGKLRDQVMNPELGGMIVSNGSETIVYNAMLGQYTRRLGTAAVAMANAPKRGISGMLIQRYGGIERGALAAKRLTDESVTLDGEKRDCIVLEIAYPPSTKNASIEELPKTFWIDAQTHLVLKQHSPLKADMPQLGGKVEQKEDVTFQRAMLNPTLPDSMWVFRPPAGSREVTNFGKNDPDKDEPSGFTGKPAIDFTLKDLKGKSHALKSLRGKVVLLDFWATWCGPCRITMPQVAKIHAEYKNRGVEVMSINVGEPPKKAGDYMKKNGYTFTSLLDEDRGVSTKYQINGIPTLVVIGRDGTVSDYMVGARDDVALRAALKKAGVE